MIRFFVDGTPVAQARPRFNTRTGRAYDKAESVNYKAKVAFYASRTMKDLHLPMYEAGVPLKLELTICRPVPQSWSNKKKQKALGGELFPVSKPDVSNYLKGVEDALNGICYVDDSAIIEVVCKKTYNKFTGILIAIFKYS